MVGNNRCLVQYNDRQQEVVFAFLPETEDLCLFIVDEELHQIGVMTHLIPFKIPQNKCCIVTAAFSEVIEQLADKGILTINEEEVVIMDENEIQVQTINVNHLRFAQDLMMATPLPKVYADMCRRFEENFIQDTDEESIDKCLIDSSDSYHEEAFADLPKSVRSIAKWDYLSQRIAQQFGFFH